MMLHSFNIIYKYIHIFKIPCDFIPSNDTNFIVTLVSAAIIIILIISEFFDYKRTTLQPSLLVDSNRRGKMRINVNITFPRIPCLLLSMDVMDVAGEFQTNVHHTIYKGRLDSDGNLIDLASSSVGEHHENTLPKGINGTDYCG